MSLATEDYLKDLETLANSDLEKCDINLLDALVNSWETPDCESTENQEENKINLKLCIQDMSGEIEPLLFECAPSWTGRTTKQKLFECYSFPVDKQTLLINSILVDDVRTLKSYNISNDGDSLTLFLMEKNEPDHFLNQDNSRDLLGASNAPVGLMQPIEPTARPIQQLEQDVSSDSEYKSLESV